MVFVCKGLKTLVAGRREELQSSGIEKLEEGFKDARVGVVDDYLARVGFNHIRAEHGGKDGTAGRDDEAVGSKRFPVDQKLDIRQLLGLSGLPEFIQPSVIDQLVIKIGCRAGKLHMKRNCESGVDFLFGTRLEKLNVFVESGGNGSIFCFSMAKCGME